MRLVTWGKLKKARELLADCWLSASEVALRPAVGKSALYELVYIVCLNDGKKLEMLKRHPQNSCSMTPDQCCER